MANQPQTLTFEQFVRLMQRKTPPEIVEEKLVCVCTLDERVLDDWGEVRKEAIK